MRQVRIYITEHHDGGKEGGSFTVSTAEELEEAFKKLEELRKETGCRWFHYELLGGKKKGWGHYISAQYWLKGNCP